MSRTDGASLSHDVMAIPNIMSDALSFVVNTKYSITSMFTTKFNASDVWI